jgi:hypothetical protein
MTGLLVVGDQVVNRQRPGTVEAVGGCGWFGCRFGADCVTVRFDGGFTTENRRADELISAIPIDKG